MLPEFRSVKRAVAERLAHEAQISAADSSLLQGVSSYRQHEGDRTVIIREDDSTDTIHYDKPLTAEIVVATSDMRKQGPGASIRAVESAAEQLAAGMSKRLLEVVEDATDRAGNVVDAGGKPFTLEMYADGLEKMDLSFDEAGMWNPPTLVMHPSMLERYRKEIEKHGADSAVTKRINEIVERKRKEHHAREACRALVD